MVFDWTPSVLWLYYLKVWFNWFYLFFFIKLTWIRYFFTCGFIDIGKKSEVVSHKNCIAKIALSFGGVTAGERNGERGYMLTFVIAYIRVRNNVIF